MSDVPVTEPAPTSEGMDTHTKIVTVVAVASLLIPMMAITATVVRLTAKYGRIPALTLALPVPVFIVMAFVLSGVPDFFLIVNNAVTAWSGVINSETSVGVLLMAGGWWSVTIGVIIGVVWAYFSQDTATDLRPGVMSWWKARKLAMFIRTHTFPTGVTLGVRDDNPSQRVAISERTANGHILVTGATGAGKTVGVLSTLADAAAQGDAVVYIDLKGGDTVPDYLAGLALKLGRPFQHFSLFDSTHGYNGPSPTGPATYNPAGSGDATRRKDLLTKACGSSVEFYKNMTADYVQVAFAVLLAADPTLGGQSAISAVVNVMDPRALQRVSATISRNHKDVTRLQQATAVFVEQIRNREFMSSLKTFQTYLSLFTNSVVGPFITAGEGCVDFSEIDETGAIVCFSLNSSLYGDLAGRLATLIVEDLTTYAGTRFSSEVRPFRLVVDEFAVIDSANLLNLISRGREAGMCVTLATQTLADLEDKGVAFKGQIIDNVAGFVVFRANSEADARTYSGLTGDLDAEGGYAVPWQKFLSVDRGQCWFINKTPQDVKRFGKTTREDNIVKVNVVPRLVPNVQRYHEEPLSTGTAAYLAGDWLIEDKNSSEDDEMLSELLHTEPDIVPTVSSNDDLSAQSAPSGDVFTGLTFPSAHVEDINVHTVTTDSAVDSVPKRKLLRPITPPVTDVPPGVTTETITEEISPIGDTETVIAPKDTTPTLPSPISRLQSSSQAPLPTAPPAKRRRG